MVLSSYVIYNYVSKEEVETNEKPEMESNYKEHHNKTTGVVTKHYHSTNKKANASDVQKYNTVDDYPVEDYTVEEQNEEE